MFTNIGGTELIVILVILFLLFGSKKLTEIGKTIGEVMTFSANLSPRFLLKENDISELDSSAGRQPAVFSRSAIREFKKSLKD